MRIRCSRSSQVGQAERPSFSCGTIADRDCTLFSSRHLVYVHWNTCCPTRTLGSPMVSFPTIFEVLQRKWVYISQMINTKLMYGYVDLKQFSHSILAPSASQSASGQRLSKSKALSTIENRLSSLLGLQNVCAISRAIPEIHICWNPERLGKRKTAEELPKKVRIATPSPKES